ncbi:MAG TPA: hypothetical protein VKT73_07710 [Xanthobacteraceae bacterium]|nr:hypothetical protein [Xanthobacteraceae bacterium]
MGANRATNAHLTRLETAAALAGCALICTHQSAEELHSALVREYLSTHGRRQAAFFASALAVLAALFIWL